MRASYAQERAKSHELAEGTLARFAEGLGWDRIHALDPTRGMAWWRCAVADGEHRGLLRWDRQMQVWRLSDEGRAVVRGVS